MSISIRCCDCLNKVGSGRSRSLSSPSTRTAAIGITCRHRSSMSGVRARVPTVIISPFAKKGFIDHTIYDTTAILKLIETRFGLEPLGKRDKCSKDMNAAFEFEGRVSAPPDCESKPAAEAKPESAPAPQAQPRAQAEPKP